MATRMQQRRGTSTQWTSANPILAAGEIGFETNTSKFKIGDGINHWEDLVYYASAEEISNLIDGAPELLNTLGELAAAIGDDEDFVGTVTAHTSATTDVHGIADTSVLATHSYVTSAGASFISTANSNANTLVTDAVDGHAAETTSIHGIADTSALATKTYADDAVITHNTDTTSVHGIADTSALATTTYADAVVSTHNLETTSVHGISDTANLVYASDLSSHASDTTNIHGISNTADLATTSDVTAAAASAVTDANADTDSKIGDITVDGTAGNTITDRIDSAKDYADSQIDTHVAITTNVHGIADTSKVVLKDATSTTLDGSLTVSGNLVVEGTTTTVSAQDLVVSDPLIYIGEGNTANLVDLGLVSSFDDGTYQHSGIARDASAGKWKIFKGVTDEPTTTINFAQGSLDDLAVNNVEVSGVVFTDGTQTKQGVPSQTSIIKKTDSYTLSSLTEKDSLIEVAKSSATTITIPPSSSVNFPIGSSIDILQTSTGQVTIVGGVGVTVNATPGLKLRTQWSSATLFKRDSDTWVVMGDLSA